MRTALAILSALAASAAFAQSTTEFYAYEGPPMIRMGEGGTKTTKLGVDFWTSGTPYRRYQIIGTITDSRSAMNGVSAIGSPSIAKRVLKAGGNALIVIGRETSDAGMAYGYNPAPGGSGYAVPLTGTHTQMAVIKYLPDNK